MVDVVLVLLVIMMVSANFIATKSLRVELPSANQTDGATPSPWEVEIAPDGAFALQGAPVSDAELVAQLAAATQELPDLNLVVKADGGATHAAVIRVMDLARSAGVRKFALAVQQGATP
jgi:biopolymer transport protein ExbD